jgi:ankyrin repeat protein
MYRSRMYILHDYKTNNEPPTENEEFHLLIKNLVNVVNQNSVNLISNFLTRRTLMSQFDINSVSYCGHTALSLCINLIGGSMEYISMIGGSMECQAEVEKVKSAVVTLLIKSGASVHARIQNEWGFVNGILHMACNNACEPNVVQLLLKNGINANDINTSKQTPLHLASFNQNVCLMSLLIDHGANSIARDVDGDTPMILLMSAFSHVIYNIDEENRFSRIDNCFDLLLQNGSCLNEIGCDGKSFLFSVINGLGVETFLKKQFIKKLLDNGADVNIGYIKDSTCTYTYGEHDGHITYVYGDTPLHAAARLGDIHIVKLLLCYNPDINQINCRKKTALDYAIMNRRNEVRDEIVFYKRTKIFQFYQCN